MGLAIVEKGKIVESKYYLIKPYPCDFCDINIKVHGITPEDVCNAPSFGELWAEIKYILQDAPIIAHNAKFDISVLSNSLEDYEIYFNPNDCFCTYRFAQKLYRDLSNYKLHTVCKFLGIPLDHHHNAESDAIACATILCRMLEENSVPSVFDLDKKLSSIVIPPPKRVERLLLSKIHAMGVEYIDNDFLGKSFVFTGELVFLTRQQAWEIVQKSGGIPRSVVSKHTDYLVVGIQDDFRLNDTISSKNKKALELIKNGAKIQIISENDFMNMIDDKLYRKCILNKPEGEDFEYEAVNLPKEKALLK